MYEWFEVSFRKWVELVPENSWRGLAGALRAKRVWGLRKLNMAVM